MENANNPLLGIGATVDVGLNHDWCINGLSSLEAIVNVEQSTSTSRIGYVGSDIDFAGKRLKATVDVKTTDSSWKLEMLYEASSTWSSATAVDISTGESSPYVQLEIPSEATRIWIRIRSSYGVFGNYIITDNWCLEEV